MATGEVNFEMRSSSGQMVSEFQKAERAVDGVDKATGRATKSSENLGKQTGSIGKLTKSFVALGGAVAGIAIGTAFRTMIQNTERQQAAMVQLETTLKSTQGAAGKTADELFRTAGQLQKVTRYGDEAIIEMQALLLTFKDIKGDNFDRTSKSILDMATAMKVDLKSATIQLGKALNDPAKNLSALSRSGITFSESQIEMIKSMQAAGDMAGAQTLILQELETQFGGSAEAARNTLGGALDGLSNAWGDLFEATDKSAKGMVESINALEKAISSESFKTSLSFFADTLGLIAGWMAKISKYTPAALYGKGIAKVIEFGHSIGVLTGEIDEQGEALAETIKLDDLLGKSRVELTEITVTTTKRTKSLWQETKKLSAEQVRAQESIAKYVEQLEFEVSMLGKSEREQKIQQGIRKLGTEATDDQKRAVRELIATLYDYDQQVKADEAAAKAFAKSQEEAAKALEEAAERSAKAWEQNRDLLSDFLFEFSLGADSFSDTLDTMFDSFRSFLIKMAAEAAANDIMSFFTGNSYGGSSFLNFFGSSSPSSNGQGGGFNFGNAVSLVGTGQAAYTGYQAGGFTGAFNSVFGTSFGGSTTPVGLGSTSSINAGAGITSTGGQVGGQIGGNIGQGSTSGAAGGFSWSTVGWAAIVAGVIKGLSEVSAGKYGLGDIVTGQSFDVKYRDELNDMIGGLGDVMSDMHKVLAQGGPGQYLTGKVFGSNIHSVLGGVLGSGKSNQAAAGFIDLLGGTATAAGVGNSFSSKNVRALEGVNETLLAFADLIGGSDSQFSLWLGRQDGFRVRDAEGNKLQETKNQGDFFNYITDYILEGATDLSDEVRDKLIAFDGKIEEIFEFTAQTLQMEALRESMNAISPSLGDLIFGFQGTEEQIASFTTSMLSLATNSQINSVNQAIDDFARRSVPAALEGYREQTNLLDTLIQNFDGSAAAGAELNTVFLANKQYAYDFALSIQTIGESLTKVARDQAESIRESILTAEELREKRIAEREQLSASLDTLTDPAKIEEATRRILELNQQIFQSLGEEERRSQAEAFAVYAENTSNVANDLLTATLENLRTSQEEINARVAELLTDAASRQQRAADVQENAAQIMLTAVREFAAATGQRFDEVT